MFSIKNTFVGRKSWVNTRSSTIFPVYLNNNNDQILVFQNYWKWKSNILNINFILTLRDQNSKIVNQLKYKVKNHNEISIKKHFKIKKNFIGQIECEIESNKNLKFPYPALLLFYKNKNGFESVVHSAGRHLNSNEKIASAYSESNFYAIFNNIFTSFVHIFCGKKINLRKNFIKVKIYDEKNKLLINKKIKNLFTKPYSSKILFLENYLNKSELKKVFEKKIYIKFNFDINNIFGRLIVGNYDKKNDAFFVTHTFRTHTSKNKNLIFPSKKYNSTGYLPLMNCKPLNLIAKSYPTNAPCETKYSNINILEKKVTKNNQSIISGGKKSKIYEIAQSGNSFNVIEFKKSIPDRFNVEFNYSLHNSRHPTDIADGVKTCYQPKKMNHWGHGISKNNYETYIFIANYSNDLNDKKSEKIKLTLFSNSKKIQKEINIPYSSHRVVKLKNLKKKINSDYFSWYVSAKKVNLNIYWVSFKKTGSICGDHAF